jgi:hypothetical protein
MLGRLCELFLAEAKICMKNGGDQKHGIIITTEQKLRLYACIKKSDRKDFIINSKSNEPIDKNLDFYVDK